jgi:hypothetical protein
MSDHPINIVQLIKSIKENKEANAIAAPLKTLKGLVDEMHEVFPTYASDICLAAQSSKIPVIHKMGEDDCEIIIKAVRYYRDLDATQSSSVFANIEKLVETINEEYIPKHGLKIGYFIRDDTFVTLTMEVNGELPTKQLELYKFVLARGFAFLCHAKKALESNLTSKYVMNVKNDPVMVILTDKTQWESNNWKSHWKENNGTEETSNPFSVINSEAYKNQNWFWYHSVTKQIGCLPSNQTQDHSAVKYVTSFPSQRATGAPYNKVYQNMAQYEHATQCDAPNMHHQVHQGHHNPRYTMVQGKPYFHSGHTNAGNTSKPSLYGYDAHHAGMPKPPAYGDDSHSKAHRFMVHQTKTQSNTSHPVGRRVFPSSQE